MPFRQFTFCAFFASLTLLASSSISRADLLVADDFNSLGNGVSLTGRAPTTNLLSLSWLGPNNNLLGNGAGSLDGVSPNNTSATLDLGASYFTKTPGVYQLTLDVTQTLGATGSSWIGLGFSTGNTQSSNLVDNGGLPWMLYRQNGAVSVYGGPGVSTPVGGTSPLGTSTAATGTTHTLKLELNTTTTLWSVNAYVDSTQIDLNGATAGLSFTYSANPTTIRYLTIATGLNGAVVDTSKVDNFTFSGPVPVPEPQTAMLMTGMLAMLGGVGRWRRRTV